MTVRVDRRFHVDVSCDRVWEFIADPANRARAISVVKDFEITDANGRNATWFIELPIPFLSQTVPVETTEIERAAPNHVKFVGESRIMRVVGEHRLEDRDEGCIVINTFEVDGLLPGVERFFKRNLDTELRNLEAAMRAELAR